MSEPSVEDTAKVVFNAVGYEPRKVEDTLKNSQLTSTLLALLKLAGLSGSEERSASDKVKANLIYTLATSKQLESAAARDFIAKYIANEKIKTHQLKHAIDYFKKNPAAEIDVNNFEKETGVGVTIGESEISAAVDAVIQKNKQQLEEKRYKFPIGSLIGALQKDEKLKWAVPAQVKEILDAKIEQLLGPKTEEDTATKEKKETKTTEETKKEKQAVVLEKPTVPFTKVALRHISQFVGQNVQVSGWVHNYREGAKGLLFVDLRDGTGFIQCVLSGKLTQTAEAEEIHRDCTVHFYGQVTQPPEGKTAKWSGLELQVSYWELVGKCPVEFNEILNDATNPDVLFDQRHIALRGEKFAAYMRLRSHMVNAFHEHYADRGYTQAFPPTFVQTQAEGGAELFALDYFGEPAYLTQSSQLYLETLLPVVGNCYCIAQSYRAEKSRTRRHLSEYSHLEGELAFITFEDLLNALEDLICDVIDRVIKKDSALVQFVNPNLKVPKRPFKRMAYVDAIQYCNDHGILNKKGEPFVFGDDIQEAAERKMTDDFGEIILLVRFPITLKAFYMSKCKDDPRLSESVDVLVPGVGEVIGASMRIHDYDELMAAYKREGLDPAPYYWYTDQRKYGTTPHGGYGLGVERFLTYICADDHIRNVCTYPRYVGRCAP